MSITVLSNEDLERLRRLAATNGVATDFWDWSGKQQSTSAQTLLKVLEALEVPVTVDSSGDEIRLALAWSDDQPWTRTLPACTVVRHGGSKQIWVHVPDGQPVAVWLCLENGIEFPLEQLDQWVQPRVIGGELVGRATFEVPGDLPKGYHAVFASVAGGPPIQAPLYVVPNRLQPRVLEGERRYWGVNVQAYSVRSKDSWGLGDAEDLANLTAICADKGADFVLINPLHASEPISPVEDSPYLPVSRRWLNVTYIRPEGIPEFLLLGTRSRIRIERERQVAVNTQSPRGGALNRDQSWESKKSALETIFGLPRSIHRQAELVSFVESGGKALRDYALWAALVEFYGTTDLPEEVADPETPRARELEETLKLRIDFHQWCQWIAAEQLREPNLVAGRLGMSIGIMADLAVGVHRLGSEFWSMRSQFAATMSVGAPPDMYSQQGQDWSQPPWNPRALESSGYAPLRDVFAATMALSGALRIDHILGLFRLWWIPCGDSADQGTYVNFDHEAMVGILLLEAERRGVLVIGEDLGTVEPWVRQFLADRGVLGTSVLWFEKDDAGWPLPADHYRQEVLATVNTHDLPPTSGYMEGVQTTLREKLGMLVEPVDQVRAADRVEQERMLDRLKGWGLIGDEASHSQVIAALHHYIGRTPSRLVAAALVDAVGEKQPQNLPGTHHEYPNWRIPLSDSGGKPIWLEELAGRADLQKLFAVMREELDS